MPKAGRNVYQRGDRWYFRFEIDGKDRRGVIAGATTEHEAVVRATQIRQELLTPPTPVFSLAEAMDKWFRTDCDVRSKRNTVKRYEGSAKPLLAYFGARLLTDIQRKDLSAYARMRVDGFDMSGMRFNPVEPSTVRTELTVLSSVFRFAINEDMCKSNPVSDFDKRHLPLCAERVRWLTDAQFADLVHAGGHHSEMLGRAVLFAGHTGMRFNEQFGMLWEWVDLEANVVRIPGSATKTRRSRTVPLDRKARSAIEAMEPYRKLCRYVFPWRDRSGDHVRAVHYNVYPPYQTAVERASLHDFRWHDLRHHCASRWVRSGVDLYRVSKLLGHTSVTQTEKYAHLAADDLHAAVRIVERHDEA